MYRAILTSVITVIAAGALTPGQAADIADSKNVVASLSAVRTTAPEPVVQRAMNIAEEQRKARELKERRDGSKPAENQDRIVRSRDLDHQLILGGGAAIPM